MSVPFSGAFAGRASGGIDTGDIGHSLRFRRSASAYIATGVTTAATSTYFAFFKQGALDAINPIFDGNIKINANNTITAFGLTTSTVARDPTSHHWIHVSNNGLVFDGVNLGAVTTSAITNLRLGYDGTNYADMYGSRMCCVSGSSLAYTDFVYFNSTINEWVTKSQSAIKALADAGGAASFFYDFDDVTSLTTLGYDKSSKGNNGTLNNFSLTTGTTYDHMLDVPGNSYATWSSIDKTTITVSDANLAAVPTTDVPGIRSTFGIPLSGKWYWEVHVSALGYGTGLGIANNGSVLASGPSSASTRLYQFGSWFNTFNSGVVQYSTDQAFTVASNWSGASQPAANDVIMIAVDMDNGSMWVGKQGAWFNSSGTANPATNTDPRWTGLTGTEWFPYMAGYGTVTPVTCRLNAGQRPFAYTPPTDFLALCQANLDAAGTVTLSGSFTGKASADGPFVWVNGELATLTINGNAVTWGTHADKTAGGFKLRTSSASYNAAGSNTWTATKTGTDLQAIFKYNNAQGNP